MHIIVGKQLKKVISSALILGSVSVLFAPVLALAVVQNPTPTAKISFTFDDGFTSSLTQAAPILANHGLVGTNYVITGCVGTTGVCRADETSSYLTWAQVKTLQDTYHWEIASHTVNHYCLATAGGDCQTTKLTAAQMALELSKSKSDFAAQGISVTDFASPYGDYDNSVLAEIAKNYASHRGFADQNNNIWAYNDYLINVMQVQNTVTVAAVQARIDQAIANKQWLVLTFHDIKVNPNTGAGSVQYSSAKLDQIAAYVQSKVTAGQIQSVTVNKGLVTSDTNLLPNSTFNSGIGAGWTTDAPANITLDSGTHGSYPDATNSIKLVATTKNIQLFSPKVTVNSTDMYLLKNFINVANNTDGELAFYIDEYNAAGDWISGQYKTAERGNFVESMNFTYTPTSASVTKASLQVIVTANSGITAYLDNPQWFSPTASTPPPPPPTPTNLLSNGTFDNGIADGWTTNSTTTIKADAANNGSPENPVNSVSLQASTVNRHLFSPIITVDPTKQYTIGSYLNLTQITSGVLAYYIDEYDTNGDWISGQYKLDRSTPTQGDISFNYTPTSASVKKASLQIITVGNSGTQAYFDNATWYQN